MESYNFDNCIFRSETAEPTLEKPCCNKKKEQKLEFICWKLSIVGIKPNQCEKCEFFKDKKEYE